MHALLQSNSHKRSLSYIHNMRGKLLLVLLCLARLPNLSQTTLDELFLGININDTTLYDQLAKNKHVVLSTDKNTFYSDNLILGQYKGTANLYSFADSVHFQVWSVLNFGAANNEGKYDLAKLKSGIQLKLFIYHSQKTTLDSNYTILKEKITEAIKNKNPDWTNQEGAREGIFFLTDNTHPILSIGKDMRRYPYLVLAIDSFSE